MEDRRDRIVLRRSRSGKPTRQRRQRETIATGKYNASFWVICESKHWVLQVTPPDLTALLFYEGLMMRQEPALHDRTIN